MIILLHSLFSKDVGIIKHKIRFIVLTGTICTVLLGMFYLVVLIDISQVKRWMPTAELQVAGHYYQPDRSAALTDGDIEFFIDHSGSGNGIFSISGWMVCTGVTGGRYECRVLLYDPQKAEYVSLTTQMTERSDVSKDMNDRDHTDIDYTNSGFLASCNVKSLSAPIEQYHLFFLYECNGLRLLVNTGMNAIQQEV